MQEQLKMTTELLAAFSSMMLYGFFFGYITYLLAMVTGTLRDEFNKVIYLILSFICMGIYLYTYEGELCSRIFY